MLHEMLAGVGAGQETRSRGEINDLWLLPVNTDVHISSRCRFSNDFIATFQNIHCPFSQNNTNYTGAFL